jgi:hypothetical protein
MKERVVLCLRLSADLHLQQSTRHPILLLGLCFILSNKMVFQANNRSFSSRHCALELQQKN